MEKHREGIKDTSQDLRLYGVFIEGFYVNMFSSKELAEFNIANRSLCDTVIEKLDRDKAFSLAKEDYEVADDEDLEFTYTALKDNYNIIKKDTEFLSLYKEIESIV